MSDRKSVICHVCGIETKRFADHLASAHHLKDFKTEKINKEDREKKLSRDSFTSDLAIFDELDNISGTKGNKKYDKGVFLEFLRAKGWVITNLAQVPDNDTEQVMDDIESGSPSGPGPESGSLSGPLTHFLFPSTSGSDSGSEEVRQSVVGKKVKPKASKDTKSEGGQRSSDTRDVEPSDEDEADRTFTNQDDGDKTSRQKDDDDDDDDDNEDDEDEDELLSDDDDEDLDKSRRATYAGRGNVQAVRAARKAAGLNECYPRSDPLLVAFADHLKANQAAKRDIDNKTAHVSKLLFYLSSLSTATSDEEPQASAEVLRNTSGLTGYFNKLTGPDVNLKPSALKNEVNSALHFIKYYRRVHNLAVTDPLFYATLENVKEILETLLEGYHKQINKDRFRKTAANIQQGLPFTAEDVQQQTQDKKLMAAVNAIVDKYNGSGSQCRDVTEYNLFMRYLLSVIVFGHVQRPGVAANLTLDEFLAAQRASNGKMVIMVGEHKTSASGPASIALEDGHYKMFRLYVKRFRPATRNTTRFFLRYGKEKPIHNVQKELDCLQREFGLRFMCSSNARHVAETRRGEIGMDDAARKAICTYLRHSETTASKHYDFSAVETSARNREALIELMGGTNDPDIETASNSTVETDERLEDMKEKHLTDRLHQYLLAAQPVSLDGEVPRIDQVRQIVSTDFQGASDQWKDLGAKRALSRWREDQRRMRAEHVASSLRSRMTEDALTNKIEEDYGWTNARKVAKAALGRFQSPKKRGQVSQMITIDQVDKIAQKMAQGWDGLKIVDGLTGRGRGVMATRTFQTTEVVCHYGGTLLNHKDGKAKYQRSDETAMGYMFEFRHKGIKMWRDATEETPGEGRLINHSKCHANLKVHQVEILKEPHLIFTAAHRIDVGDELLFDYNDNQSRADFLRSCPVCEQNGSKRPADSEIPAPKKIRTEAQKNLAASEDLTKEERQELYEEFETVFPKGKVVTRTELQQWKADITDHNASTILLRRNMEAATAMKATMFYAKKQKKK